MHRRIKVAAVAALCLAGALTISGYADPAGVFIDLGLCATLGVSTESGSTLVITNSKHNNVLLTCHGTVFVGVPAKTTHTKNPLVLGIEACPFLLGAGATGAVTIRPNGKFTLHCANKS